MRFLIGVLLALASVGTLCAADPCQECHGLPGLGVEDRSLWIHPTAFAVAVHGGLACADCHKNAEAFPHPEGLRVRCDLLCHVPGASHEEIAAEVAGSAHAGLPDPPCLGCHGGGAAPSGADVEALCRSCHADLEPPRGVFPDSTGAFGFWAHRRASVAARVPTCLDCHGVHGVGPGETARGSCSTAGCHDRVDEKFGRLFDHAGSPTRKPWGGAGRVALVVGAVVGVILLLHSTRG